MAAIRQRGHVTIGVKFDVAQFGYLDPQTNQPQGFDVDLGRIIATALGVQPVFVEAIGDNRITMLQSGRADLVISTMTINEARRQKIDFSVVYYVAGQTLLVRKGSHVVDLASLDQSGGPVCTSRGSTSATNIAAAAPHARIVLQDAYGQCFQLMEAQQVPAMTTDDVILLGFLKKDPLELALVAQRFSSEPYGIGMAKGHPELVAFVDSILAAVKKDGRWLKLYDQWVKPVTGVAGTPPPDAVQASAPAPR